MKILALDTSTDACSAALLIEDTLHCEYEVTPRAHTRLILPMVERVLAQGELALKDIDAIAFGRGPGAFTGVRIGAGVTQGLALAADKPVIPVSTLAALAQQAYINAQAEHVLVALDARMNEVYWGEYQLQDGYMQLQGEECVISPELVPQPQPSQASYMTVGNGWQVYEEVFPNNLTTLSHKQNTEWLPAAEYIARLAVKDYQQGLCLAPELAEPIYLRNKVALTIKEREAKKST